MNGAKKKTFLEILKQTRGRSRISIRAQKERLVAESCERYASRKPLAIVFGAVSIPKIREMSLKPHYISTIQLPRLETFQAYRKQLQIYEKQSKKRMRDVQNESENVPQNSHDVYESDSKAGKEMEKEESRRRYKDKKKYKTDDEEQNRQSKDGNSKLSTGEKRNEKEKEKIEQDALMRQIERAKRTLGEFDELYGNKMKGVAEKELLFDDNKVLFIPVCKVLRNSNLFITSKLNGKNQSSTGGDCLMCIDYTQKELFFICMLYGVKWKAVYKFSQILDMKITNEGDSSIPQECRLSISFTCLDSPTFYREVLVFTSNKDDSTGPFNTISSQYVAQTNFPKVEKAGFIRSPSHLAFDVPKPKQSSNSHHEGQAKQETVSVWGFQSPELIPFIKENFFLTKVKDTSRSSENGNSKDNISTLPLVNQRAILLASRFSFSDVL